jgi:putative SOS response-associated peptidase YedK
MCGRYTLATSTKVLVERFRLAAEAPDLRPRFNIAPSQPVAVVANRPERRLELFLWGLIPSWAKDPAIGNRMINARAETLAEKPSFRDTLKRRRCLVLADGFFEWRKDGKQKTPIYVRLRSREPFAFAGLWDMWRPAEGDEIRSCTIVTTDANGLLAPVHDRMPVILPPETYEVWLDPRPRESRDLQGLLRPYPDESMEAYPVSRLVNSPTNDRPECIERVTV